MVLGLPPVCDSRVRGRALLRAGRVTERGSVLPQAIHPESLKCFGGFYCSVQFFNDLADKTAGARPHVIQRMVSKSVRYSVIPLFPSKNQPENNYDSPSVGHRPPPVRGKRVHGSGQIIRGHKKSLNAPRTPIPELASTGGAKDPIPAKEVPDPQVALRDLSMDGIFNVSPDTLSFAAGEFFAVILYTSPVDLEKRL